MTENTVNQSGLPRPFRKDLLRAQSLWALFLGALAVVCLIALETRFHGLSVTDTDIDGTPVTLYQAAGVDAGPPVIVAHGFAGSRQMMDQIAVTLARQGFFVASVDLPGHGRNPATMSPDITDLNGTTADLVRVVENVATTIAAQSTAVGPMSFVGHSMASDVVIRAAQNTGARGGVVAVSMYSPAVTATSPNNLLVVSGARETHLRAAGLDAVRQIKPDAEENQTVEAGNVQRRTAVAPWVGHVGVLYAPASLDEIARWLRDATQSGKDAPLDRSGWIAGVLLLTLVLLVWPVSKMIPPRPHDPAPVLTKRHVVAAVVLPIPAAALIALAPTLGFAGHAAIGSLVLILGAVGLIQLAVLWRAGLRGLPFDGLGMLIYLGCAGVFALALDRYGAAFLPTGDRALLMSVLLVGTLPLMLADAALTYRAPMLRRVLVRLSLFAALIIAFALSPTELALSFTVLPVLLLFYLVYGTMAHWIARRRGPGATAIGKALVLAWAFAASTPLFATVILP